MDDYERQARPLYCFYVADGRLVAETHWYYGLEARQRMHEKTYLRFRRNGKRMLLDYDRLDRYLNGYLYTFIKDRDKALNIMRSTVKNRVDALRYELEGAEKALAAIDAAMDM